VYLIIIETEESELTFDYFSNFQTIKFFGKNLHDIRVFIKFWKTLKEIKPQFIISNMYRSHVWSSLARDKDTKLIWVEQNTYTSRTPMQWKLLRTLSKKVYKIVGISDEVSAMTSQNLNRKLETIPNPITFTNVVDISSPRSDDFIFVGRMTHQKNPELLLRSFRMFLEEYNSNSILHLVGGGILLDSLKTLSKDLNIERNCIFHGWLDLPEIQKLMAGVKTLVSTSIIEGMGIVRLEALASGCCVVTTNTGGSHLFDHLDKRGFIICDDNLAAVSRSMNESLSANYWTSQSISLRSKIVEKFNPEAISQKLIL
jgi:glycosyltransferase involved in cell wall biosynthesis